METPDRLEALVSRLNQESKQNPVGLIYLFWGVMNILGAWINALVWSGTEALFWVFWIPFGVVIQSGLLRWQVQSRGRRLWDASGLPRSWASILLVLPLFIWFFPMVLRLYGIVWIFPLTSAWVALASFSTGMQTSKRSIIIGSLAFLVVAPLYLLWPELSLYLFTASSFLALVIPGGIILYAERT